MNKIPQSKWWKRKLFLFMAITAIPLFGMSQNQFLDFVVDKNNDTIYGTIRNVFSQRPTFYEKLPKNSRRKFKSHQLKKYKTIRYNNRIYKLFTPSDGDGIYASQASPEIPEDSVMTRFGDFISVQKRLPDFVITKSNDTIYGEIKNPSLERIHLLDATNSRVEIEKQTIKKFRFNNDIFEFKNKKPKVNPLDDKEAYLQLLLDGNLKLYEYGNNQTISDLNHQLVLDTFYYIEKNGELILINNALHKKTLVEIFSDNKDLVSRLLNKEYVLDNIYLMVKFYNEMSSHN